MTAVAVWIATVNGRECVLAASDSRISSLQNGGVFTDSAAKILPLRLKYLRADGGPFVDSGESHEYGFAYSGHAEVVALTYFAVANLAAHVGLSPLPYAAPLSLAHVAGLVATVLQRYTEHYVAAGFKDDLFPRCQIALFGVCPANKRTEIHLVESSRVRPANARRHETPEPLWLGDGAVTLRNVWQNLPPKTPAIIGPLIALEGMVDRGTKRSVGGGTQFAQVDDLGYHVFCTQQSAGVDGTAEYLGYLVADDLDPALGGTALFPMSWIQTKP